MTRVVYSVTGAEINLTDASTEDLAEVVDGMNDEMSRLSEARQLVFRELARRMENRSSSTAGEWSLSFKPYVSVSRKHV